jgi:ribosomal protein S18 acetylase RimI-like enzyme
MHRGTGLGERLDHAIIQVARSAGYGGLRLDTLASMASAQSLYRRFGFTEIPAYNRAHLPGTRPCSLRLTARRLDPADALRAPPDPGAGHLDAHQDKP